MATKKPTDSIPADQESTVDPLPEAELVNRDSMQVQVLRGADESPMLVMCKVPRLGWDLKFNATIRKKGTDIEIEGSVGTVQSEQAPKKK